MRDKNFSCGAPRPSLSRYQFLLSKLQATELPSAAATSKGQGVKVAFYVKKEVPFGQSLKVSGAHHHHASTGSLLDPSPWTECSVASLVIRCVHAPLAKASCLPPLSLRVGLWGPKATVVPACGAEGCFLCDVCGFWGLGDTVGQPRPPPKGSIWHLPCPTVRPRFGRSVALNLT